MKSAVATFKLRNPIHSFHSLPATVSLQPQRNPHLLAPLGLRGFTTSGWVGLSECRSPRHCDTWWSSFWKAGLVRNAVTSPDASRRQLRCYCFGIPNLDSANMSNRQLRVRKEKTTITTTTTEKTTTAKTAKKTTAETATTKTATTAAASETRNESRSTSEASLGEVEKLNKENFGVESWQFQLLERHEANNLNSYTVAELRQLLREMQKQPKGQKSDLLKAVKSWLSDHGCQSPSEPNEKLAAENSLDQEVTIGSNTRGAVSEQTDTENGMKRAKSTPKNRKRRKEAEKEENSIENSETEKPEKKPKPSKKGAKKESVVLKVETGIDGTTEPWTVLVHKKPQPEWVAYNPKTMRPEPLAKEEKVVKLLSWNVNGLRALLKEKGVQHEQQGSWIARLAAREDFDVLCLQETKLQEKDVEDIRKSLLASHEESLWSCSTSKLGYSGTAIISRIKPLSVHYGLGVPDHDKEGRLITCEFDSFYFIVSYVPNAGAKLERLAYRTQEWDVALSSYMKELEKKKPVILTGDLNCAHEDIDIHDPAGNKKSAGFTEEERESFRTNFLSNGFVDTFRMQHPLAVAYTYWGYRTVARPKNRGWRLDYFLVSESLAKQVHDSYTIPDVGGSDHCPLGLILRS